jgi:hypothetical protein
LLLLAVEHVFEELELRLCDAQEEEQGAKEGDGRACHGCNERWYIEVDLVVRGMVVKIPLQIGVWEEAETSNSIQESKEH